jgi:hypothetical protein
VNIEFTPPSDDEVAARLRLKRDNMKKSKKKLDKLDRVALTQMRVLQRNLLYVTNLPVEYAKEDVLARPEFFGQYGRVKKIAINNRQPVGSSTNASASTSRHVGSSASAYVTFANEKGHDAYNAILACDGAMLGGRQLKVFLVIFFFFFFFFFVNCFLQGGVWNDQVLFVVFA